MKRELRITSDGSPTVFSERWNQHYHSVHGAFNESMHVFISHGLNASPAQPIRILEFGMGTGINVWLTCKEASRSQRVVFYDTLEAFPLGEDLWRKIEVGEGDEQLLFEKIHELDWEQENVLAPNFTLRKMNADILSWQGKANHYDVIYFDAFAPSTQSELWTVDVFEMCHRVLKPGGFLVTYCAQGQVKRNMKAAGFEVRALPGPPMKREMTRAIKPNQSEEQAAL